MNGHRIYMDIMTGKQICRQFRLIKWTSFIDKFVHQEGGEGMDAKGWIKELPFILK